MKVLYTFWVYTCANLLTLGFLNLNANFLDLDLGLHTTTSKAWSSPKSTTMPKYRSITLSVMSQWEMKQFPEFPHPDSSQCRYRGPTLGVDGSEAREPTPTLASISNANKILGRVPSISCYIPSIPGMHQQLIARMGGAYLILPRRTVLLKVYHWAPPSWGATILFQTSHEWPSHMLLGCRSEEESKRSGIAWSFWSRRQVGP